MSAFRRAVLSVAPERLEQFTIEMKKNISEKHTRKRNSNKESSTQSKSGRSKSRKRQKCSSHDSHSKKKTSSSKSKSSTKTSERKKSGARKINPSSRSRSKERKHRRKSSSGRKDGDKQKKLKDDSDFDPKDLDLTISLLPLSDMIKDRKAMLETVFSIIKGPKLTSMLPDILKLTPIDEIKQLCEEQLSVMSSKRILHTLSGEEMQSSSGTDSSDEDGVKSKDISPDLQMVSNLDDSLQANLVDSTTNDHHSGPSMLFPSAVSTALASAMETSNFPVIARKIKNDNNDEDDVSTSTEPNFIYTEEIDDRDEVMGTHPSSDTEEGEVQTSEDESDDEEEQGGSGSSPNVEVEAPTDIAENIEEPQDVLDLDVHPIDEVLVEVEEIEEHEEEQVKTLELEQEENIVEISLTEDESKVEVMKMSDHPLETELQTSSEGVTIAGTENTVPRPTTSLSPDNPPDGRSGKTQLEILELELRARAIKSLMRAAKAGMLKPSK